MLVQLICSQKELKIANWGDVLRAIQSNPEGISRCSFFHFSRCQMRRKLMGGMPNSLSIGPSARERLSSSLKLSSTSSPKVVLSSSSSYHPPLGSKSKGRYGALPLWYAIETTGREDSDLIRLVQLLINLHPQGCMSLLSRAQSPQERREDWTTNSPS